MTTNTPYIQFLETNLDPIVKEIDENQSMLDDPTLNMLRVEPISGSEVSLDGRVNLHQSNAKPSVYVGDTWQYTYGDQYENVGSLKSKKVTVAAQLNAEEAKKAKRAGAITSLILNKITSLLRKSKKFATMYIKKFLFGTIATTSLIYDPEFVSPLKKSNAGTLADPNDVNSNTTLDLTAIAWSGALQTINNVITFAQYVKEKFTIIDVNTDMEMEIKQFVWFVGPHMWTILTSNKDIVDVTNKNRSPNTYIVDLANAGIIVVKENQSATHTVGDGNAHTSIIVGDIGEYVALKPVTYSEDDDVWTEWREINIRNGNTYKYIVEKHKEVEFMFMIDAFDLNGILYKPVLEVSTTPTDDT